MEERINRAFDSVNDLGRAQQIEVTPAYHKLRLEELYLTHEYQEKRNEEREEQRRIQEQIREEQRAQREFEKAQKEAEAEELRQEKALERARAELEKASGKELEGLTAKIVELEEKVRQAEQARQSAISRAQVTKSGHVYVISNLGSFGEDVYKIGMTRRLDPEDRVREYANWEMPQCPSHLTSML